MGVLLLGEGEGEETTERFESDSKAIRKRGAAQQDGYTNISHSLNLLIPLRSFVYDLIRRTNLNWNALYIYIFFFFQKTFMKVRAMRGITVAVLLEKWHHPDLLVALLCYWQ